MSYGRLAKRYGLPSHFWWLVHSPSAGATHAPARTYVGSEKTLPAPSQPGSSGPKAAERSPSRPLCSPSPPRPPGPGPCRARASRTEPGSPGADGGREMWESCYPSCQPAEAHHLPCRGPRGGRKASLLVLWGPHAQKRDPEADAQPGLLQPPESQRQLPNLAGWAPNGNWQGID